MELKKRQRLRKKGWKAGTVQEFLGLSDEENALVEIRARLAFAVQELRTLEKLTQAELARRTGSSQSRVAKMEAKDPSVSIDLLIRTLVELGASTKTVGAILSEGSEKRISHHLRETARRTAEG